MATNHLKQFYSHLIRTVERSTALDQRIAGNKVWTYPESITAQGYFVELGKVAITIWPGDSTGEEPIHNDDTQSEVVATEFNIILETKIGASEEAFLVPDTSNATTLLDYEYLVLRALQDDALQNAATGDCNGWVVSRINRDVPVVDADGNHDPETRRTEIVIVADILMDRTETGTPWR